jgi:hypothetical protein
MLGEALLAVQEPGQAVRAFEAALELSPHDSALACRIGKALVATHDYQRAVDYFNKAIRNSPGRHGREGGGGREGLAFRAALATDLLDWRQPAGGRRQDLGLGLAARACCRQLPPACCALTSLAIARSRRQHPAAARPGAAADPAAAVAASAGGAGPLPGEVQGAARHGGPSSAGGHAGACGQVGQFLQSADAASLGSPSPLSPLPSLPVDHQFAMIATLGSKAPVRGHARPAPDEAAAPAPAQGPAGRRRCRGVPGHPGAGAAAAARPGRPRSRRPGPRRERQGAGRRHLLRHSGAAPAAAAVRQGEELQAGCSCRQRRLWEPERWRKGMHITPPALGQSVPLPPPLPLLSHWRMLTGQ